MSIKSMTYYTCDVCATTYHGEDWLTKINFSYDSYSGQFDCCYNCMRGNEKMKSVYQRIIDVIIFWGKGEAK